MSALDTLVYISRPRPGLSNADIAHILATAHARNPPAGLTGFLAFNGDAFLQVLEGPPDSLMRCLRGLIDDRRHHGLRLLACGPIGTRLFSDWSMGYAAVATRHHALVPGAERDATQALRNIDGANAVKLLAALAAEAAQPALATAGAEREDRPVYFSASSTRSPGG